MRSILLGLLLFFIIDVNAQRECATPQYVQTLLNSNAQIANNIETAQNFTQRIITNTTGAANRLSSDFVVKIPVVVHIIYNDASQNISEAQVKSQIDALNRDFRRLNEDSVNTPSAFKSLAADVQIEFALATADPKGKATSGIIRKASSVKYWQMDDKIKYSAEGGDDAWDSRFYLNIWVGYTRSLLGYSSVVGTPAEKDGIVINTAAFGTGLSGAYDKGRTAVHEVGHWLGLKHIWGDALCGDDGIEDTPKQSGYTTSCPTGVKTSSCSTTSAGDMYMNYMDFTNDGCLNLFTKGQKEHMRSLFAVGAPRNTILLSKGLSIPLVAESPLPEAVSPVVTAPSQLNLYPNPALGEIVLDFENDETWIGKELRIYNVNGVVMQVVKVSSKLHRVSLSAYKSGIYFLKGVNGGKNVSKKFIKI